MLSLSLEEQSHDLFVFDDVEYVQHIEKMHSELILAWEKEERVKFVSRQCCVFS